MPVFSMSVLFIMPQVNEINYQTGQNIDRMDRMNGLYIDTSLGLMTDYPSKMSVVHQKH